MLIIATYHPFGRLSHGGEVAIGGVRFFEGDAEQTLIARDRSHDGAKPLAWLGIVENSGPHPHTPALHMNCPVNRQNATSAT